MRVGWRRASERDSVVQCNLRVNERLYFVGVEGGGGRGDDFVVCRVVVVVSTVFVNGCGDLSHKQQHESNQKRRSSCSVKRDTVLLIGGHIVNSGLQHITMHKLDDVVKQVMKYTLGFV